VVVSGRDGVSAFPFDCGSDGSPCQPAWIGPVDHYAALEYADEHIVVLGQHQGQGSIVVFPTECSGRCQPLWASAKRGKVYGVTSDGSSVFAAFADGELRAYPVDCHDPCEAAWKGPVRGDVWWILVDSDHLIGAGREGFEHTLATLTVFHDG
jgi:hypothetical protein